MTLSTRKLCLDLLKAPAPGKLHALLNAFEEEDSEMAPHLRQFHETGESHPYGYRWTPDGIALLGIQYTIVRIVTRNVAVRFACECGRDVLSFIEEAHPSEKSPRGLVETIDAWLSNDMSKKEVKGKLEALVTFASRIDGEWHVANTEGRFDSLSQPEYNLTQRLLSAVDVVGYAAQSVGLTKNRHAWLKSCDQTADAHIDARSIVTGKKGIQRARKWQLAKLAELIERSHGVRRRLTS